MPTLTNFADIAQKEHEQDREENIHLVMNLAMLFAQATLALQKSEAERARYEELANEAEYQFSLSRRDLLNARRACDVLRRQRDSLLEIGPDEDIELLNANIIACEFCDGRIDRISRVQADGAIEHAFVIHIGDKSAEWSDLGEMISALADADPGKDMASGEPKDYGSIPGAFEGIACSGLAGAFDNLVATE